MGDREEALAAVRETGALEFAPDASKGDKQVVVAAVPKSGDSWIHAINDLKKDKDVLFEAFRQQGLKELMLVKVKESGKSLEYASDHLKGDKDVVLAAVRQNGHALKYAAESLKMDREVVLAAVKRDSTTLKYALGGLNQDPEFTKAAGLIDKQEGRVYSKHEKAILSNKFSLSQESSSYATYFVKAMRRNEFFQQFKTYNPNAESKKSCDPEITNIMHYCKGTFDTCQFPNSENLAAGRPTKDSCWRFAYRFHLQESKDTNGFMIQMEEKSGLGNGQKIEAQMAKEVGLKIFRTYTNSTFVMHGDIENLSQAVQEWYDNGCFNNDIENIFVGTTNAPCSERPRYGEL